MNVHSLIRGNNIIWNLLYYDELINHKNYQLTYFAHANEDYYNCAHAVSDLSKDDLKTIEEFYKKRNLATSFYTDPVSKNWLIPRLIEHGYKEVSDQEENWWVIDLTDDKIKQLQKQSFLTCEPSIVNVNLVHDEKELDAFIKIDQEANALSKSMAHDLKESILEKKYRGAKNYYLLGTVDKLPAFCGCIGIYEKRAYFAEGGTLKDYRRCGLHSFMTQNRLLLSFSKGAKLACITCTTKAHTNKTVKKLGFSLAFSRKLYKK